MSPRPLAQSLIIAHATRIVRSAPTATPHKEPPHMHSLSTVHLAVIISITLALAILYTAKLHFLQVRTSTINIRFNDLALSSTPNRKPCDASSVDTQGKPGSPFLLGFLGSPARELRYVATDLLRLTPSGRLLKRQYTPHPLKGAMGMVLNWIKEPGSPKLLSRLGSFSSSWTPDGGSPQLPFQRAHGACPIACAALVGSGGATLLEVPKCPLTVPLERKMLARRRPADTYISEHTNMGSFLLNRRATDRRQKTSELDTSDVIGNSGFSTSLAINEGSEHSPWLASLASLQLGPTPGQTFLEDLESTSPMPLKFRLPSPLLPAKKKSSPTKRRSPLRSILPPQTLSGVNKAGSPPKGDSGDTPIPLFSDVSPIENGKAASYKELGLGRPSQSPVSLHRTETDAESFADSPTLELMLEQLVQATSDWDDSILIDDKFKSLLDSTKRSDHTSDADHQFTVEMKCSDSPPSPGIELPKLKDFDDESIAHPNPFLGSPYILRDRTRDLLFSIPEEDVISFTNIVIQTY
ncbi:hypothetical protein FA13DRAFT_1728567 [Coprinellus micaceus]|uniref:Uncharacterized protein n=1 Tax=Coprinellus micaceus TaxID=71717 RepID=A0A4Y7TP53_COPMI|nr:hypothetical protein FA13DRAFT_1728567 [Coprinellus micaceus]